VRGAVPPAANATAQRSSPTLQVYNVASRVGTERSIMKRSGVSLAIALAMLSPFVFAADSVAPQPVDNACRKDADCRLIYSSCTCEAVSASDPRKDLDNDHGIDCHHNVCRSEHARAVCNAGVCARDPVSRTTSPRK